ncbi:MAG: polysaccharide pyruvyl transferase family protein [Eubacterium sp.]|nr:polysaccharide pyruvyl transferase family protein [Eubacterium sp.]
MIGILTFYWADDYGAMLQAYALKHYLEKTSNKQVRIIPYAPVKFTGRYWLCPIVASYVDGEMKYSFLINRFKRNMSFLYQFLKRRKNMRAFRCSYLTRKLVIRRADGISLKKYSCVFVGSDQVWNPEITVGLDDAYMGNIKRKGNCKIISYGASFGGDMLKEEYILDFKTSVNNNFAAVSLREKSAVPFVSRILQRSVSDVLDPTLLLEQKEWEQLGKLPYEQGYILFIYTEYNKEMVQYLQDLSVILKKKVIQLSMPWPGQNEDWIDIKIEGGPSEFIGYFQNASYVVTNSFHGMVFSVLMEKQFLVFKHSSKNARIENFLKKVDLESRLIKEQEPAKRELIMNRIDWKYVKQLLEKEKKFSIKFIQENCEVNKG